jgi:DnaJ-class molecular chaperone
LRQISAIDEANDTGNEVSLSAVNEIICFKCGGIGPKVSTCPENGKGGAKGGFQKGGAKQKDKRKCYRCGKIGHIAPKQCFEDKKNASKRLANWKSVNAGGETVASAIDSGNRVEYLLWVECVFRPMPNS